MYKILIHFSDGTSEYDEEAFDSKKEADEYGKYLVGCTDTGIEILTASDSEEYSSDDYESLEFEIVEIG